MKAFLYILIGSVCAGSATWAHNRKKPFLAAALLFDAVSCLVLLIRCYTG